MKYKRKIMSFDTFVSECEFFDGDSVANNGYGCNHLHQEKNNLEKDVVIAFHVLEDARQTKKVWMKRILIGVKLIQKILAKMII